MINVSRYIYEKVQESNFCLGYDAVEDKNPVDSQFVNVMPRMQPIISVQGYFDECDDDYETDLSFATEE